MGFPTSEPRVAVVSRNLYRLCERCARGQKGTKCEADIKYSLHCLSPRLACNLRERQRTLEPPLHSQNGPSVSLVPRRSGAPSLRLKGPAAQTVGRLVLLARDNDFGRNKALSAGLVRSKYAA